MFCINVLFSLRVPDISATPRIISPLGKSQRMAFNLALSWKCSQPFMFPSISSIFFSARIIWLWLFLSCFLLFLGWLGGCGRYFFIRRVPDISHPTRIISSPVEIPQNGIQHSSFLEVPPKCPNLSCFPLFLPSIFQQEAFGRECFFHVCSVSGLVGRLQQLLFYSKGSGHLTYP